MKSAFLSLRWCCRQSAPEQASAFACQAPFQSQMCFWGYSVDGPRCPSPRHRCESPRSPWPSAAACPRSNLQSQAMASRLVGLKTCHRGATPSLPSRSRALRSAGPHARLRAMRGDEPADSDRCRCRSRQASVGTPDVAASQGRPVAQDENRMCPSRPSAGGGAHARGQLRRVGQNRPNRPSLRTRQEEAGPFQT